MFWEPRRGRDFLQGGALKGGKCSWRNGVGRGEKCGMRAAGLWTARVVGAALGARSWASGSVWLNTLDFDFQRRASGFLKRF